MCVSTLPGSCGLLFVFGFLAGYLLYFLIWFIRVFPRFSSSGCFMWRKICGFHVALMRNSCKWTTTRLDCVSGDICLSSRKLFVPAFGRLELDWTQSELRVRIGDSPGDCQISRWVDIKYENYVMLVRDYGALQMAQSDKANYPAHKQVKRAKKSNNSEAAQLLIAF